MGFVIGMAGHVDHGKSSVIKALTGITTARYREEIEREITIDIGFAHLDIEGAGRVSIIDVPGHEDFVHNMLAGVFGMKIALLVVAANEGVMPQTAEHFEILKMCGVSGMIVVLNKSDLVSDYDLEYRRLEIEEFLRGTPFEGSPIVAFSAATGSGAAELIAAVKAGILKYYDVAGAVRSGDGPVFYPVDRAFEKAGYGYIVTGTLISGRISTDDSLAVTSSGAEYENAAVQGECRVRGMETHGKKASCIDENERVALNITKTRECGIGRGSFIVSPEILNFSKVISVRMHAASNLSRPLKSGARVKFYFYTACYAGKIRLINCAGLAPGGECFAQVIFDRPRYVLPFKKFIVRAHTDEETFGGGIVLDSGADGAVRNKKRVLEDVSVYEKATEIDAGELFRIFAARELAGRFFITETGISKARFVRLEKAFDSLVAMFPDSRFIKLKNGVATSEELLKTASEKAISILKLTLGGGGLETRVPKNDLLARLGVDAASADAGVFWDHVFERLARSGKVLYADGAFTLPGDGIQEELTLEDPAAESIRRKITALFSGKKFEPAQADDVKRALPGNLTGAFNRTVKLMEARREVYKIFENYYISRGQFENFMGTIRALTAESGSFNVASFRDKTGLSRKFIIPILEYFDKIGVTRREGDARKMV